MSTDREIYKKTLRGQLGSSNASAPDDLAAELNEHSHSFLVQDAATAGTDITETELYTAKVACRVKLVQVAAPIAVTAHATTNAVFTLAKRTAGGAATTLATDVTTSGGTGSLTAFAPVDLPLSTAAGALDLAAGDSITFKAIKGSTGVALTAATSYFKVQFTVEDI